MPKGHYPFIICTAPHQRDLLHRPSSTFVAHLNCASEYGLSLLTWGREWDWMTPRPARRNATGLDVMEEPRSAWMVSCPSVMPCFAQVAAMSFSARAADSRAASIQPVTERERMSRMT